MSDPQSQFSLSINVVFFTARIRRHITLITILFITRRGILYIRIAENVQNLDTRSFALSSRTRVHSGLLNRRTFFFVRENIKLFPRHNRRSLYKFTTSRDVFPSEIIAVKSPSLSHYHMNGPSILRFMFTESSRKPRKREIFYIFSTVKLRIGLAGDNRQCD